MNLPNAAQRERLIQSARLTLQHLEALPILTPCSSCAELLDGFCRHWQQAVPPEHIESGCAEWAEPIPF